MSAPVMHFELAARDRARLADFYSRLLGWKSIDQPGFGYTLVQTSDGRGIDGGVRELGPSGPGVLVYAQVDDVDRVLANALALGAFLVQEPYDVPAIGRFAVFADPEGNRTGLWMVATPAA